MRLSGATIAVLLGVAIAALTLYLCLDPIQRFQCFQRWNDSDLDYKYSFLTGCKVKTMQFGWIPDDKVRAND